MKFTLAGLLVAKPTWRVCVLTGSVERKEHAGRADEQGTSGKSGDSSVRVAAGTTAPPPSPVTALSEFQTRPLCQTLVSESTKIHPNMFAERLFGVLPTAVTSAHSRFTRASESAGTSFQVVEA